MDMADPGMMFGTPEAKKRGRPKKIRPEGEPDPDNELGISPPAKRRGRPPGSGKKQLEEGAGMGSPSSPRKPGRPPGSGKNQLAVLSAAHAAFTPHVLNVLGGEDVAAKILSFPLAVSRCLTILSANGMVAAVALRQPAAVGGTQTVEGRFEILSLSGSFLPTDNGRQRTGGLSICMSAPDGRVLGGGVAGLLIAASPVQIVMGSFIAESVYTGKVKRGPNGTKAATIRPGETSAAAGEGSAPPAQIEPAPVIAALAAPPMESVAVPVGPESVVPESAPTDQPEPMT